MGFLFVSCDNSDDIKCPEALTGELTEMETSFSGTWALTAITSEEEIDLTDDDTDNPSTDLYSQFPACDNDSVYTFESDRNYTYIFGKTEADCDSQQEATGTWQLTENSSLIFVSGCSRQITPIDLNEENTEFTIEKTLTYTDVDGNSISTKTTFTYSKTV